MVSNFQRLLIGFLISSTILFGIFHMSKQNKHPLIQKLEHEIEKADVPYKKKSRKKKEVKDPCRQCSGRGFRMKKYRITCSRCGGSGEDPGTPWHGFND